MARPFDLFSYRGRVTRLHYVVAGVLLFAIKYGMDLAVSTRFQQPWNPLMYVSLRLSPLSRMAELPRNYVTALFAVAVPFIVAGVLLSARRLRDMGVHPFWSGLFFLPLLHFAFFAVLAAAPSRATPPVERDAPTPYRDGGDAPPMSRAPTGLLERIVPRSEAGSFVLGVLLSLALGLGCFVITTQIKESLGIGLFLGVPFGMGFLTGFCTAQGARVGAGKAVVYALLTQAVAMLVLLALAWEGIACIVMAAPILGGMTALGGFVGWAVAGRPGSVRPAVASIGLLPLLIAFEGSGTPREPAALSVVSEITIAAPPEVVWQNVIAFPPIDAPPEPIFAVVAMPLEANIDGSDPGATRRCVFTNGTFVEPIEVWNAPRELSFTVKEQPGNLDRYLDVTRGQFLLTDNHDGTTTVRGTTWYRLRIFPTTYWKLWADTFLHAIHMRVLRHVKKITEHPEQATGVAAEMPDWMKSASHTCKCTTNSLPKAF